MVTCDCKILMIIFTQNILQVSQIEHRQEATSPISFGLMVLVLELQISKGSSLAEKKRIRRRNYTSVPLIITLIGSASHSRVTCHTQFHNLLNRVNVTIIPMTKSPTITVEQSHVASRAEFYNSQITLVSWLINRILFERNYPGFYIKLYGLLQNLDVSFAAINL